MKSIYKVFSCLMALLICLPTTLSYADKKDDWTQYTYIAHALGGINQDYHVNSVDGFNIAYQNGFKVFETDLSLTRDNQLVDAHDWSGYTTPPTYDQFMNTKVLGKYTPTDFKEVVQLMEEHPDMYLDTDTKETDPATIQKQFTLLVNEVKAVDPTILDRIIPEIYNPQMYQIVNSIYPFKNEIYSIWLLGDTPQDREDIVQFMVNHNLKVMCVDASRLDASYMKMLNDNHIMVYAYTVNSTTDVAKLEKMGVHGVYTDFLIPPADPKKSPSTPV